MAGPVTATRTAERGGRNGASGIGMMCEWRAESEPQPRPAASDAGAYAAIGRKT
jgi:hypothetical protein